MLTVFLAASRNAINVRLRPSPAVTFIHLLILRSLCAQPVIQIIGALFCSFILLLFFFLHPQPNAEVSDALRRAAVLRAQLNHQAPSFGAKHGGECFLCVHIHGCVVAEICPPRTPEVFLLYASVLVEAPALRFSPCLIQTEAADGRTDVS